MSGFLFYRSDFAATAAAGSKTGSGKYRDRLRGVPLRNAYRRSRFCRSDISVFSVVWRRYFIIFFSLRRSRRSLYAGVSCAHSSILQLQRHIGTLRDGAYGRTALLCVFSYAHQCRSFHLWTDFAHIIRRVRFFNGYSSQQNRTASAMRISLRRTRLTRMQRIVKPGMHNRFFPASRPAYKYNRSAYSHMIML